PRAPASLVSLTGLLYARRPCRRSLSQQAAIALVTCAAIGSWKYIDNIERSPTPLFANGSAQQGFVASNRTWYWREYDFHSLRIGELVKLAHGRVPPGHLTDLPFYHSVWT